MNDLIENARIARASIYLCDHGVWTSTLTLEGDGWCQGYGGYRMQEGPWMGLWVRGVCEMLMVDDWAKVQGSVVRVRRTGFGCASKILQIGHIVENRWFNYDAIVAANGGT
jgi:hypothetical protein